MSDTLAPGSYAVSIIGHNNNAGTFVALGTVDVDNNAKFSDTLEFNNASAENFSESSSGTIRIPSTGNIEIIGDDGEINTGFYNENNSFALSSLDNDNSELSIFGIKIREGDQEQAIGVYGAISFLTNSEQYISTGVGFFLLNSDSTLTAMFEYNTPSTTENFFTLDTGTYSIKNNGYIEARVESGHNPVGYIGIDGSAILVDMEPDKSGFNIIATKLTNSFDPSTVFGNYGVSVFGASDSIYFAGLSTTLTLKPDFTWLISLDINANGEVANQTVSDLGNFTISSQGEIEFFSYTDKDSYTIGYIGENGTIIASEIAASENPVAYFGVKISDVETPSNETSTDNNDGGLITDSGNEQTENENINATVLGSFSGDTLTGDSQDNTLKGLSGDDLLDGGNGIDTAVYTGDASQFSLTLASGQLIVRDATEAEGTDTLTNIELLQFADRLVHIESSSPTYDYTDLPDELYQFFIVAFGATPGVTYMDQLAEAYQYFEPTVGKEAAIQSIVDIFTTKSQYLDLYPDISTLQDRTNLVEDIVKSSASAAAKAAAVQDIGDALAAGWSVGKVIYTVFGNLANQPQTDPTWGGTAKQFANQLAVANYYTEVLHQSTDDVGTLRNVLKLVGADSDVSSDAAIVELIGVGLLQA